MQLTRKTEPNNQIGEKSYRELRDRLSYSALKLYTQSRYRFYKELIMGEIGAKESTPSTVIGDLTHTLLAEIPGEFESKFHISSAIEPKGQLGELCQALYTRSIKSLDSEGMQLEKFETLFSDAVNSIKYGYDGIKELKFVGKNLEKILELFTTPDKDGVIAEHFYKEKMECVGKQVVSINQIESAEKLVELLKTHPYTCDIVNMRSGGDTEVFNELIILYAIDGILYRSMIDKCIINHHSKEIHIYDYKCSWSVETGWEYSYLQYCYYLQVALYDIAMKEWVKEHGLEGYQVLPMRYITVDTTGQSAPVVYCMTDKDVLMGKRGFTVRGKHYQGTMSIHKDICWNIEAGIWNTNQAIHDNGGVMEMKLVYR